MAHSYCDGIDRRGFFKVGSLGGLTLAETLRLQALSAAEIPPEKRQDVNCIFIFIIGGMAHQDMWDPKPEAPAEIRGDFNPIQTNVPGMLVTDILPNMAQVADQFAILRGLTHTDPDHTAGYHVMMTGAHPGVGGNFNRNKQDNNVHPALGSMVSKVGGGNGALPPYISVPNFLNSGGPAFFGASHAPFVIESDPASPEFSVRDIVLPEGVATDRSQRRQSALREINRLEAAADKASATVQAVDVFQEKAYNLMTSQKARVAFDISRESQETRDAYGMTSLGQCCLLGRRMVEAGSGSSPLKTDTGTPTARTP